MQRRCGDARFPPRSAATAARRSDARARTFARARGGGDVDARVEPSRRLAQGGRRWPVCEFRVDRRPDASDYISRRQDFPDVWLQRRRYRLFVWASRCGRSFTASALSTAKSRRGNSDLAFRVGSRDRRATPRPEPTFANNSAATRSIDTNRTQPSPRRSHASNGASATREFGPHRRLT